ncbi:hypothetical protein MAR_006824 [Mya arenaria]|uniref:Uncharacterized protein n=1 Tax=Mya arenaria TaxID=6604 RepID=A0ABY7DAQ4_MYAAR|nr:hypothetical protein MAR_006824 [Mya arenaria]
MAAPMACSPATLMAIKLQKCEHGAERQVMKAVQHGCTASEVFEELHAPTNPKLFATKYEAATSLGPVHPLYPSLVETLPPPLNDPLLPPKPYHHHPTHTDASLLPHQYALVDPRHVDLTFYQTHLSDLHLRKAGKLLPSSTMTSTILRTDLARIYRNVILPFLRMWRCRRAVLDCPWGYNLGQVIDSDLLGNHGAQLHEAKVQVRFIHGYFRALGTENIQNPYLKLCLDLKMQWFFQIHHMTVQGVVNLAWLRSCDGQLHVHSHTRVLTVTIFLTVTPTRFFPGTCMEYGCSTTLSGELSPFTSISRAVTSVNGGTE